MPVFILFLMFLRPPISTLFPYTTLFRSRRRVYSLDGIGARQFPMRLSAFSLSRWMGIVVKEFIQLRRDRLTFGMIVGIPVLQDRKSTRLNSSHSSISYAVFCLKKKNSEQ